MTETHITLYGEKSEAFEAVKEEIGPDGVESTNTAVVMRLIEEYQQESNGVSGGLTR